MGILDEFTSKNFSLYGQWAGLVSIIFLIVFGVLNLIHNPIFSIIGWVIAFILVFVELPLCTRFCPTSPKFDAFISKFENAILRAAGYFVFSLVMFLSNLINASTLLVAAVTLLIGSIFYGIAALKKQPHASSRWTGGTGVDNIV